MTDGIRRSRGGCRQAEVTTPPDRFSPRFALSLRDAEELLAAGAVAVERRHADGGFGGVPEGEDPPGNA